MQDPQAALAGPVAEAGEGALGVAGVPLVHLRGVADEGDVTVAQVGEVVGAECSGGGEVVVDAGESGGVGGQADQRGVAAELAQHGNALVV